MIDLQYSKARTNAVFSNTLYDDNEDISCNGKNIKLVRNKIWLCICVLKRSNKPLMFMTSIEIPPLKRKKKKAKKKTWRERLQKMMKPLHSIFCKWSCCTPAGKVNNDIITVLTVDVKVKFLTLSQG